MTTVAYLKHKIAKETYALRAHISLNKDNKVIITRKIKYCDQDCDRFQFTWLIKEDQI